ncbi:short chain dehydrogenase [Hortaea werneckii]|uniref:Uncharacterized protein n=2 Tax=Hortaea werneckii TaxID=91943 RepID=A0A3M7HKY6_HORWE|nr:short chain dehydrogenase [Hortaea werneckii]OTA28976.1 hypothetical protein BTJ68_09231 [Hortaea werneckii EXF-2000]KAI6849699.1 short chain dehydrogenase [Hortaea werneckii]KAI6941659.1 short chain dehydrogenase [Hortaea werneckii]KAI6946536.1 short chain dehydrogenase [Hortaea werneckii]
MSPALVSDLAVARDAPEPDHSDAAGLSAEKLFRLRDRTVMITGAGRGLGLNLAYAILETGADVCCLDVLQEPDSEEWATAKKIAGARNLHISYDRCDITDEASVEQLIKAKSEEARGRGKALRGLVNSAGIQQMEDALDYPIDGFRRMMEVNVTGSYIIAKQFARAMVAQKSGASIVLIASMSGNIANRGLHCSAYNTSKGAVHQMCRSLAYEWGEHGIRVNTLSPGYIRTAMTDALLQAKPEVEKQWMAGALLGRFGAPEDFRAPTIFLLADGASFMTGTDLRVDGGHCATA